MQATKGRNAPAFTTASEIGPQGRKRVCLYLRVSTDDQTTDNQRHELLAVAERHNWHIVAEYVDHGISGAKGRDQRPAFDKMLKAATRREVDMIASWSVDRLGRSLQHLVEFLGEIHAAGVDLYLHQQGLDTATPAGKAMFQMLGIFSEFERSMIVARVNAGITRARETGTRSGKPFGRPRLDAKTEAAIREALKASDRPGLCKIASNFGVGNGTVERIARTLQCA